MTASCPVCLEPLHTAPIGAIHPCGHVTHVECWDGWVASRYNTTREAHLKCVLCNENSEKFTRLYLDESARQKGRADAESFELLSQQNKKLELQLWQSRQERALLESKLQERQQETDNLAQMLSALKQQLAVIRGELKSANSHKAHLKRQTECMQKTMTAWKLSRAQWQEELEVARSKALQLIKEWNDQVPMGNSIQCGKHSAFRQPDLLPFWIAGTSTARSATHFDKTLQRHQHQPDRRQHENDVAFSELNFVSSQKECLEVTLNVLKQFRQEWRKDMEVAELKVQQLTREQEVSFSSISSWLYVKQKELDKAHTRVAEVTRQNENMSRTIAAWKHWSSKRM